METRLNRAFRDRWTAALRSGEYEQGRGEMRNKREGTFCCLGVACVVERRPFRKRIGDEMPSFAALKRWGLAEDYAADLAGMNDSGRTFSEIADYIDTLPVADGVMGDAS